MKIKQLSVFLENKPGQLLAPCEVLSQAGINIITLALADTQQFGILRLIVQDWERARALLEQSGAVVKVTDVMALEVNDQPGGLAGIVRGLDAAHINIEYMYAFTFGRSDKAVMIFRFEDNDAALEALKTAGINIVDSDDLYRRANR